jgi:hypothetical protein
MIRASVIAVAALALAAGCKGETVYKDKQETLDKLDAAQKQLQAQKDELDRLRADAAKCSMNQNPGEIVVTIEGDIAKIKPGHGGGGGTTVDDATTAKQSQAFLDMVQRSRGAIQKCYEQALKKNSGLQARTISLKLSAKFQASGDFAGSDFNPSLGDVFDSCLRTVAGRWKMPAAPAAMTFQANVSLSPT